MNLYQMITLLCSIIGGMTSHHGAGSTFHKYRNGRMASFHSGRKNSYKHQTESLVSNNGAENSNKKQNSCSDNFKEHLNKCMETFTSNIDTYTRTKPKDPFLQHIFVQYVCRNYKKMLLCIHVVLTNCKTVDNIEIVQNKLGHDWVLQFNNMCRIQSQNSTGNSSLKTYKHTIHNEKTEVKPHQINRELTNSALFNKLMHSSDTDGEIITMLVFRSALRATKQAGSLPNTLNGADKQKIDSLQKYHPSNFLHLFISLCQKSNKEENSVNYKFLAQNENSSDKNGSKRDFCWQVVVLITVTNYLYCILR